MVNHGPHKSRPVALREKHYTSSSFLPPPNPLHGATSHQHVCTHALSTHLHVTCQLPAPAIEHHLSQRPHRLRLLLSPAALDKAHELRDTIAGHARVYEQLCVEEAARYNNTVSEAKQLPKATTSIALAMASNNPRCLCTTQPTLQTHVPGASAAHVLVCQQTQAPADTPA